MSIIKLPTADQLSALENTIPCLLDIESSSLSAHSYPIEIAWYRPQQEDLDSFLIRPADFWTDWDDIAEEGIHQISRSELEANGITPVQAAKRLNQSLAGTVVFTDGFSWDRFWLEQLFSEANVACMFFLAPLTAELPDYHRPHRALPDVLATFQALEAAGF